MNAIAELESQHPQLKLMTIMIKAAELLGGEIHVKMNPHTGDVEFATVIKGLVIPESSADTNGHCKKSDG